jgi:hypothetical protein
VPPIVLDKPSFVLPELSLREYTRLPSVQSSYPFPLGLAPWKETWALILIDIMMDRDK